IAGPGVDMDLTLTAVPQVLLTTPANGMNFAPGLPVTIAARATDPDGMIASASIAVGLSGQTLLENPVASTSPTYSIALTNLTSGVYQAEARAVDDLSAQGISQGITFTVGAVPNDQFTNR